MYLYVPKGIPDTVSFTICFINIFEQIFISRVDMLFHFPEAQERQTCSILIACATNQSKPFIYLLIFPRLAALHKQV